MKATFTSFNLGLISKYKVELMGLSIILIVLGHARASGVVYPFFIDKLIIASLGTICFFLLSGMGMYYSLSKLSSFKKELLQWYKRSYTRLLVQYLILSIPVYAITIAYNGGSFIDFILRITTISFWYPPHEGMWFIAMIIPLYLLSPIVFWVTKKLKHQWSQFVLYVAILIVMIMIGKYSSLDDGYFYKAIFFFIGMWIAPCIKDGKRINWPIVILLTLPFFVIARYIPILKEIPRVIFLFPTFLFVTCAGYEYLSHRYNKNIVSRLSDFIGRISLEMYLAHVYFAGLLLQFQVSLFPEFPLLSAYIQYTVVVALSLLCSIYVNRLSKRIMKSLNV